MMMLCDAHELTTEREREREILVFPWISFCLLSRNKPTYVINKHKIIKKHLLKEMLECPCIGRGFPFISFFFSREASGKRLRALASPRIHRWGGVPWPRGLYLVATAGCQFFK